MIIIDKDKTIIDLSQIKSDEGLDKQQLLDFMFIIEKILQKHTRSIEDNIVANINHLTGQTAITIENIVSDKGIEEVFGHCQQFAQIIRDKWVAEGMAFPNKLQDIVFEVLSRTNLDQQLSSNYNAVENHRRDIAKKYEKGIDSIDTIFPNGLYTKMSDGTLCGAAVQMKSIMRGLLDLQQDLHEKHLYQLMEILRNTESRDMFEVFTRNFIEEKSDMVDGFTKYYYDNSGVKLKYKNLFPPNKESDFDIFDKLNKAIEVIEEYCIIEPKDNFEIVINKTQEQALIEEFNKLVVFSKNIEKISNASQYKGYKICVEKRLQESLSDEIYTRQIPLPSITNQVNVSKSSDIFEIETKFMTQRVENVLKSSLINCIKKYSPLCDEDNIADFIHMISRRYDNINKISSYYYKPTSSEIEHYLFSVNEKMMYDGVGKVSMIYEFIEKL